jgi:predicted nucleic acid-binding protein
MSEQSTACLRWVQKSLAMGSRIVVPEIADYEVRRELLRAGRQAGLTRLDELTRALDYLPITTEAMKLAAELWARTRQQGKPTADNRALDGDVILAAQVLTAKFSAAIVATTNVGHLSLFVPAALWTDIAA